MAGDGDGDRVRADGCGDGAGGRGAAEFAGKVGVAAGFAARDLLQGLPDALLEGGGADVEREGRGEGMLAGLAGDEGDGVCEPAGVALGGDELGLVEALAQVGDELGVVAAEGDGADAGGGGGDEHAAERAGGGGVADEEACSAFAHDTRGHAEGFAGGFVEAAGGAEAGFVDGVDDALGFGFRRTARGGFAGGVSGAEGVFEAGDALGLGELSGGDAEDAAESAQDGEAADSGGFSEVGEAGALGGVLGEVVGGGGDGGGLRVGTRDGAVGLAALAGAVAGLFGGGRGGEEADVLFCGATAGTAGAAVDLGGFNGVEELAVGAGVALEHLLPLAAGEEAGYGEGRRGTRGWSVGDLLRVGWRAGVAWTWVEHCVGSHTQYLRLWRAVRHSAMFTEVAG